MRKNCGIIVEPINSTTIEKTLFGRLMSKLSLKAFADEADDSEGGDSDGEGETVPHVNYEDLIRKARKEEKDKQYNAIQKLKKENQALVDQHNKDLLLISTLQDEVKEAKDKLSHAGEGDSEELKTLKGEVKSLTKEKDTLEQKVKDLEGVKPVNREELENEIRAELEQEYEVKSYRLEKMTELKDDILVPELVIGDTKEAIDASIKVALARSKEILKGLGVDTSKQKRTPRNPSNPDVSSIQDAQISLEYLATLNPASAEYRELRKQLGLK